MDISELQRLYTSHPNSLAMNSLLKDSAIKTIFLGGLHASAASLFLSTIFKSSPVPVLFILNDLEEAGYFYHDLVQANGEKNILFFPSSYRRAIKYGQSDAASEILQNGDAIIIVTYPEALAEKVVSAQCMNERTLKLKVGMDLGLNGWKRHSSNMDSVWWIMCMNRANMLYGEVSSMCILSPRNILIALISLGMK